MAENMPVNKEKTKTGTIWYDYLEEFTVYSIKYI